MTRRPFSRLAPAIVAAAGRGLYKAATEIISDSQILVPVDTGTLKASARVGEPVLEGDTLTVRAGYGYGGEYELRATETDPSGPGYAVYVHEIVENHHAPPTQAKFLEQPALARAPELGPTVAVEIRKALASRQAAS